MIWWCWGQCATFVEDLQVATTQKAHPFPRKDSTWIVFMGVLRLEAWSCSRGVGTLGQSWDDRHAWYVYTKWRYSSKYLQDGYVAVKETSKSGKSKHLARTYNLTVIHAGRLFGTTNGRMFWNDQTIFVDTCVKAIKHSDIHQDNMFELLKKMPAPPDPLPVSAPIRLPKKKK